MAFLLALGWLGLGWSGLAACAGPRNAPNALYLRRLQAKADGARARQEELDRDVWYAEQRIRDDRAALEQLDGDLQAAASARRRATLELASTLDRIAEIETLLLQARVDAADADREFRALQVRVDSLRKAADELGARQDEVAALERWLAEARKRPPPQDKPADKPQDKPAEPSGKPGEGGTPKQTPPPAKKPPAGQGGG